MELNRKQLAFAHEYVNLKPDESQKLAALRAGYGTKGADQTASRLLTNAKIREFIDKRKQHAIDVTDVSIERVVRELSHIVFSNVTDFVRVGADGTVSLTDWSLLSKDQTACIESVNETKEGYRLKLYNKLTAIEMMGKYLTMFNQQPPDYEEPDQFKHLSNKQLDAFIKQNETVQ